MREQLRTHSQLTGEEVSKPSVGGRSVLDVRSQPLIGADAADVRTRVNVAKNGAARGAALSEKACGSRPLYETSQRWRFGID